MSGESLLVEYKIHQYRFDNFTKHEEIIRQALNELGHVEGGDELNIYNHCHVSEVHTNNNIIFKPTAPTSRHFVLDTLGYANSSSLAFNKPLAVEMRNWPETDHNVINALIETKSNKWDDSILLKWRKPKQIPKDHILVIGQMPDDETVHGFGFGDHIAKLKMIVDRLHGENVVIKLHPRYKNPVLVKQWKDAGHIVIDGYISIHDVLPHARVAIIDNSTAGIECLMHQVPIISYGWPEYHWATKKLQTLTELPNLVKHLDWHDAEYANNFILWYIHEYLCYDVESTKTRIDGIINS